MLINDNETVAAELPVFFYDKMLGNINGHIDLVQVKNNLVYLLDYKPDAEKADKGHAVTQLTLYAAALSFRARIPLKSMRCAFFDENSYFEFEPRHGLHSQNKTSIK